MKACAYAGLFFLFAAHVSYELLLSQEAREMKISARNVLAGTIKSVTKGAVNAEVILTLAGGETVASIITNASVDSLGLREGISAYAIIKASEVMVGKDVEKTKLSARNV